MIINPEKPKNDDSVVYCRFDRGCSDSDCMLIHRLTINGESPAILLLKEILEDSYREV